MQTELMMKLVAAGVLEPTTSVGSTDPKVSNTHQLPDPLYTHDCSACLFLGIYNNADLYFCPRGRMPRTVIARFSSRPGDYASSELIAKSSSYPAATHRELRVAWLIARDCGLLLK